MIQKLKIEAKPRCTKIFADGKEIEGVEFFSIEQTVMQELPVVKLRLAVKEVEIVGTAVTVIEKPAS